jgi:hypothetical protein
MSRKRKLTYWIALWEHLLKDYVARGGWDPQNYANGFIVPKYLRRYGNRRLRRKVREKSPYLAQFTPEVSRAK